MLLKTSHGFIPLSRVVRIEMYVTGNPPPPRRVTYEAAGELLEAQTEYSIGPALIDAILPAETGGYYYIDVTEDPDFPDGVAMDLRPVVAWSIRNGAAHPIPVFEGAEPGAAILAPDGHVYTTAGEYFSTLDLFRRVYAARL